LFANNWFHAAVSIRALFGDICSKSTFRHDQEMYETFPDLREDETQKSNSEFNRYDSRTSSEEGDYENGISDDDNEVLDQGHKLEFTKGLTAQHMNHSKDMQEETSIKQGISVEVDATSPLSKACSDASRSTPAQLLRPSSESEAHTLRRRASPNEDDRSTRKRARRQGDHNSAIPQEPSELETSEPEEGSRLEIIGVPGVSYYDAHDCVYRCETCGWEVWRPEGACTGCGAGVSAYYEVTSSTDEEGSSDTPKLKPKSRNHNCYPRIYLSSNAAEDNDATDVKAEERTKVTGYYLDGASAYDSASSTEENEYEMNSFIDDLPVGTEVDEPTDASITDDEDYKAQFEELTCAYHTLEQEHEDLVAEHESFKRDVLGSDYDGFDDQDEPDFEIVNIEVQDPPISKVVLSHVQGDSQSSAISNSRLRARADAFLAAPEGWHNISLMSTGDNHTEESQEL
jgi:hypothetical protein